MPYDYERDALYRAERRPTFVDLDSVGPFKESSAGLSLANVWWLANASHLAYSDPPGIETGLGRVGLELVEFFDGPSTQGYLATADRFAILAFRGTEPDQFRDALRDAEILPAALEPGVQVHAGFLRALDEVWEAVETRLAALDPGLPLFFTGHSLGAALATLAAARRPPRSLVTFGSPRVGSPALGELLARVPVERVVNCADIVTGVPLGGPLFRHLGEHRFFTARGRLRSNPSRAAQVRERAVGRILYHTSTAWFLPGRVKNRAFVDHAIINYSESLCRELRCGNP